MLSLDTWGVIQEVKGTAPDPEADMVGQKLDTNHGKGNNTAFPLSHPGEGDVSTEHR